VWVEGAGGDVTTTEKLSHLQWAIASRATNQRCCLALLRLFEEYPHLWRTQRFSRGAQDLTAVAFSLWRAAFLAEKSGKRVEVFAAAKIFLTHIIEDNAISYPQDKKSNEWTFNYYTRTARSALQTLAQFWPEVAPKYEGLKRNPTQRWDYCQELLDTTVEKFEMVLKQKQDQVDRSKAAKTARSEKKKRRRKVREMTLASRTR